MVNYNFDGSFDAKAKKNPRIVNNWKKKNTREGWFLRKFAEFCARTDLHGYKYIVMGDLNPYERSCWALAVVVSIFIAIYFVVTAYKWYARNPIVTVIESTQGAIWDVPFPAVTICDLNVVSRRAARQFADSLTLPGNVSADFVFDVIRLIPFLHSSLVVNTTQKDELRILQSILDLNNVSIDMLFRQLSPAHSCSHLVERCMWKNTIYRCDQLFQHVFTAINLCCAFNYFAVANITKTGIMSEHSSGSPRRVASCGYQTALTLLLKTDPNDYYSAIVASQGFLVFIDDSYNFPDLDSPVRMVNPSTEVLIALSPEQTYATAGIKSFSPKQRQCYYYDEVQFGSFRQYSFHNCMAYHKMKIIEKACECIPFYFPVKDYHRLCNFNDLDCLEGLIGPLERYPSYANSGVTLQCLSECEHFDYPLEMALGVLTKNVQHNGIPFFKDVNLENRSLLNVFFNDLVSTKYRRDVYLNWQNILAAFGGLLSLMLGFTLISGFDFILFFTFRVAYDAFASFKIEQDPNSSQGKLKIIKMKPPVFNKKDAWMEHSSKKELGKW